jgi:hypothetical protein
LSTVTMKMLLYSLKKELADDGSGLKRINLEGTRFSYSSKFFNLSK